MLKARKATIVTLASLASVLVVAGASADVTQSPFSPDIEGLFGPQGASGPWTVLYDNTFGPSVGFFDWVNPTAGWADDVHFAPNPAGYIITGLVYAYYKTAGGLPTVTHTIEIYDMVPPTGTHGFTSSAGFFPVIDKGPLAGSIVLTGLTAVGPAIVSITGLSITVSSGAWVNFVEAVPIGGRTFWLTGGIPVVGSSHDTIGYFAPGIGNYHYNHAFGGYSNIMFAISGVKVPGPSVIALLGLSGLVTLSRRRRK